MPGLLSGRLAPKERLAQDLCHKRGLRRRPTGECSEIMTDLTCRAAELIPAAPGVLNTLTRNSPSLSSVKIDELSDLALAQ